MTAPPFAHVVRPRYAEVDMQGVVFNAHWLTYFDDACTRFFEWLGYQPNEAFFSEFDLMLVKATIEWSGPAGFDDVVRVEVVPTRLGRSSLDLRYVASVGERDACVATITYVSVVPGERASTPIPDALRTRLEAAMP